MLNCYRELQDKSPFIGKDVDLSLSVKKVGEEEYRGVNFTNLTENISPHISQTHCECALHVYCREVASSLSDTLASKSDLLKSLPALHVKVSALAVGQLITAISNVDGVYKVEFGADSYSIVSDSEVTPATFQNDRLVTKESVESAVSLHILNHSFKVLLIDIQGEEECMTNWAYLSNEAMQYIVQDLGVEVVVVNTASVDRESDGGFVPNHKIIFENRHHLVIELAKLSHLEASLGTVLLNIEPHNSYADCGSNSQISMMQWNFGGRATSAQFESQYNCTSTAMAGKDMDEGDKIYLPPSALDRLARMNVEYPMLFEITNNSIEKKTHCGVLEFSAEEGWCYMPFGMMQNLMVDEGSLITVKNVSLPKASFVKFRAQSVDFLEVSNPRALLEVSLRKFTCLTAGDTICIPYSGKKFYLDVREVQPNGAASIIETDCNVDFEEPLGYKDSKYAKYEREHQEKEAAKKAGAESQMSGAVAAPRTLQKARAEPSEAEQAAAAAFKPFTGAAMRIDGKPAVPQEAKGAGAGTSSAADARAAALAAAEARAKAAGAAAAESKEAAATAAPTYQSRIGDKYSKKKTAVSAFTGTGHKLNP